MTFTETKAVVGRQGAPPDSFLAELVEWARNECADVFEPNNAPLDIYSLIRPELGPWVSVIHRRAAMCEAIRCHAGLESSWNWREGVDVTNQTSMAHIEGQETGILQVSFDSTYLGRGAMKPFAQEHGIDTPQSFIAKMKSDHTLALSYYARLVRVNIAWAGPLIRKEINPFLSRRAVAEFQGLLSQPSDGSQL